VDAASKGDWDRLVGPLKASLRHVGADPGAMTGVRLSRLPGQWRAEKGMWQRLLYVNALPLIEAVADRRVVRDVEADWMEAAKVAWRDQDSAGAAQAVAGLRYYGTVRPELAAAADDLEEGIAQMVDGGPGTGDGEQAAPAAAAG
jgi:hypothetical protein